MKKHRIITFAAFAIVIVSAVACKTDREEWLEQNTSSILQDSYSISRFKVLEINPDIVGSHFIWSINDSIISESANLEFISPYIKNYPLTLKVNNDGTSITYKTTISVTKENVVYSRYITTVLDYVPAIGQFINELPEYKLGDTSADLVSKAKQAIVGANTTMISLGGYGGYVTFGFDHTIPNMSGRDFKILGNAFWDSQNSEQRLGSCEPGIVMVAYDKNKNGKPDANEWYEIAGSEYFKKNTTKNYSITYQKPNPSKLPVLGDDYWQVDKEYIHWYDNQNNSGYKSRNIFHNQSYYPLWFADFSYTLTGTKLENNFYDNTGEGNQWLGRSYEFGYADNAPNDDEASNIDIAWAVDKNGNYVKLPGIDFVKVYTGVNQETGWLGEVSTEISGAYDLYFK